MALSSIIWVATRITWLAWAFDLACLLLILEELCACCISTAAVGLHSAFIDDFRHYADSRFE